MSNERIARARLALEGLSVGDAFGEQLLHAGPQSRAIAISERKAPSAKLWRWTDDTAMALSIVDVLAPRAATAAVRVRSSVRSPQACRIAAPHGSCSTARARAATAAACGRRRLVRTSPMTSRDTARLIAGVAEHTPPGPTRDGLVRARKLVGGDAMLAAVSLGNGSRVISADTIPFAVWCGAHHITDYAEALWTCGMVGGDVDTTCAMVGGIVVGAVGLDGIPETWRSARDSLDGSGVIA